MIRQDDRARLESWSIEMEKLDWYDVLESREAAITGATGLAIAFALARYDNRIDFVIYGMHQS